MEVKGLEESFTKMSLSDKIFSAIMLMTILDKINPQQRRFLLDMLKRHFAGKETNLVNTIAAMSFNDYTLHLA